MPLRKEPSRLLESAVVLAKKAGQLILEIYESDFRVGTKEDDSPLTAADLASHHCLVEGLEHLEDRTYPVISEESSHQSYDERKQFETYWLIDPLDGTREFIKRNGEFTVNIALIHQHQPVLGVVYAPVRELCYLAAEGCGAYRQQGNSKPEVIRVRSHAPHPLRVVVGSRSHQTEDMGVYLSRLSEHELVSIGSSLKLCLVADGSADLYPRIGSTSEWDTAAAHAIVREAGGEVTTLQGHPLLYNTKPSLLNPYFVAFGDKSKHWWDYAHGISGQDAG